MGNKIVSPISYIGGKHYIKEWIFSHFDYDKRCYVELFGGAGHILLAKRPHEVEIFNDNNNLLVNFFKALRENSDKLVEELEKLPYSRAIYNEFKKSNWDNLDNLEKAVRWFYLVKCSFSGGINSWGYGFTKNFAKTYYNSLNLFKQVKERIKNVQIECRDYREIIEGIKKEKEGEIMIYADPPYINVNYYSTKWTLEDHREFAEIMNRLSCSIAISYYETEQLRDWYPPEKWNYRYKKVHKYSCGLTKNYSKNNKPKAMELLLTNYSNADLFTEFGGVKI